MKNKPWFPIVYMFIITAVLSTILLGLSDYTRARIESNAELAFESAVLEALNLAQGKDQNAIHQFFTEKITQMDDYFIYSENDQILAYALEISGKGFWADIKGIIAIEADKKTIIGISFYEQSETPGLGAEIVKPYFRNQFKGKELDYSANLPLEIRSFGSQTNQSQVSAITGATQTCTRLNDFMNEDLKLWLEKIESEGGL